MPEHGISSEVKDAIMALDNDTRMKIIEYLMNTEKLYKSEVSDRLALSIGENELENNLEILS